jgi:hypothetical protein
MNGDPLTNSKYPSEYFSLDEELLLMEGIRSSPFLTSKETPSNGKYCTNLNDMLSEILYKINK